MSRELEALRPLLVVAQEETDAYADAHPGLQVVPHPTPGRGVAHARNQALEIARRGVWPALWLLDDDLFSFFREDRGGRWCETATHCLQEAETLAAAHPCRPALVGLLPAYGRPKEEADRSPVLDQELYQCVRIDLTRLPGLWYDETLPLSEDNDLCLQVIAGGGHTFRPRHLGFLAPLPGTSPGGLSTTYRDPENSARTVRRMTEKWPEYCTPTHAGHRVDTHWWKIPGSRAERPSPARSPRPEPAIALPHCESS